jgi:hypothetical protein
MIAQNRRRNFGETQFLDQMNVSSLLALNAIDRELGDFSLVFPYNVTRRAVTASDQRRRPLTAMSALLQTADIDRLRLKMRS